MGEALAAGVVAVVQAALSPVIAEVKTLRAKLDVIETSKEAIAPREVEITALRARVAALEDALGLTGKGPQ